MVPDSVDGVQQLLDSGAYICDRQLATVVFLALVHQRPLFLEGEPGVGKTEIAKVLAHTLDRRLVRLQCYEGLDTSTAPSTSGTWPSSCVEIRFAEAAGDAERAALTATDLYDSRFLIERPLLQALRPHAWGGRLCCSSTSWTAPTSPSRPSCWSCSRTSRSPFPELGVPSAAADRPIVFITSQPHPRGPRRAEAPLPLPLGGLPLGRSGGSWTSCAPSASPAPPSASRHQVVAFVHGAARASSSSRTPAWPSPSTGLNALLALDAQVAARPRDRSMPDARRACSSTRTTSRSIRGPEAARSLVDARWPPGCGPLSVHHASGQTKQDLGGAPRLAENVVALRPASCVAPGMVVGTGQVLDAILALDAHGRLEASREEVYGALHSRLREPPPTRSSSSTWASTGLLAGPVLGQPGAVCCLLPPNKDGRGGNAQEAGLPRRLKEAWQGPGPRSRPTNRPGLPPPPNRDRHRLQHGHLQPPTRNGCGSMDFEQMTAAAEAGRASRRSCSAHALSLEARCPAPPHPRRANRGSRIDLRRTLSQPRMRTFGEPLSLARYLRAAHPSRRRWWSCCDVSGSMERYSRMMLHFLHALTNDRDRVAHLHLRHPAHQHQPLPAASGTRTVALRRGDPRRSGTSPAAPGIGTSLADLQPGAGRGGCWVRAPSCSC